VLYRYCSAEGVVDEHSNINGAAQSIAGVVNAGGNVLGMMPIRKTMSKTSWAAPTAAACSQAWCASGTRGVNSFHEAAARGRCGVHIRCHRRLRAGFSKTPRHLDRAVRGRRQFGRDRAYRRRADGTALGQTIVIENIGGAGGSTALTRAARAEPDGYTIAIGNAGTNAAAYTIYPMLPFKPDAFVPIAVVAKDIRIVALRKDFPAGTVREFIAYAKSNPGKINLGHAGVALRIS